jgi:hypothetical protein
VDATDRQAGSQRVKARRALTTAEATLLGIAAMTLILVGVALALILLDWLLGLPPDTGQELF